jgi:5-methylcytosine-specific restriction endonuclease McrA
MKKPPVIREFCGTTKGYRKHKNNGEDKCPPCIEAYNVWRRTIYDPDKNREHKKAYFAKPEKRALRTLYEQKHRLPPEEKQRLRQERLAATEEKKRLKAEAKKAAYKAKIEAQMAETAARNAEKKRLHEIEVAERARIRDEETAKRRAEKSAKKQIEARNAELDKLMAHYESKVKQERNKAAKALERAQEEERLNNQHGVVLSDYYRCQRNNGIACELCKARAAKYAREYRKANPEIARKWPSKKGNTNHKERLKPGAKRIPYTRRSILERDNYTCYLCNEPVDLSAPSHMNQPGWERYPHMDHVIPLSRGGDDTPDNVRTAHAKCNMVKRDSLLTEVVGAF